MSTVTPGISAAAFTMTCTQSSVNPVTPITTVSLPLTFGTISFVNVTSGTYTPANDTKTIHTFATTNDLPRFVFLLVDQPVTVTLATSTATPAAQFPVQRMMMFGSPTPIANWNTLKLDGTTANAVYAMTQNLAVNYSVYWSDGSLS